MKKSIFYAACLALALSSCSKPSEERFASVRFSLGVESGPITKAAPDGLQEALDATSPAGPFSLTAQSKENERRSYSVTTGETLTMAVGDYAVSGSGAGSVLASVTYGKIYSSPSWKVASDVSVAEGSSEISLPAYYNSFALVFDRSEVKKVSVRDGSNETALSPSGSDDYWVVYARTDGATVWVSSKPLTVYVYPVDEVLGEMVAYKITNIEGGESTSECINVSYGYWYKLSPGKVSITSGKMGIEFPAWKEVK